MTASNDLREIATMHDLGPSAFSILEEVAAHERVMDEEFSYLLRARIRGILRVVKESTND